MKSTMFVLFAILVSGCSSLTGKQSPPNNNSLELGLKLVDRASIEYNPAKGIELLESNASIDYQVSSAALCLALLGIEEIKDIAKGHTWCFVSMKLGGKESGSSAELMGIATAHLAANGGFVNAIRKANEFYEMFIGDRPRFR